MFRPLNAHREEIPARPASADESVQEKAAPNSARLLNLFVIGTAISGTIAAGALLAAGGFGSPFALAVLLALVVLTETAGVKLYLDGRLSISFMGVVIAAMAFGPAATALVATTVACTAYVVSRSDLKKFAFNLGHHNAGAALLALLVAATGVAGHIDSPLVAVAAGAGLAAVLFAAASGSVSLVISLSSGQHLAAVHRELFRWMLPHYLGLGAVAGGLAMVYVEAGLVALVLLAAPLALSRHSVSQVVDKTRDTMERLQRSNEQLTAANAANSAILGAIPDVMYHLNAEGRVLAETNDASANGENRALREGMHVTEGFMPAIACKIAAELEIARRTGLVRMLEYEADARDGSQGLYEARVVPVPGGEYLLMVRNVTERKRVQEAMVETQKLESLGVLAGGIAHDFNNLLVGILGNAELALLEVEEHSPARETLEDIRLAGTRAADLARQMLAYAGKGRIEVDRVNFGKLVSETSQLLRSTINKGIEVDMEVQEGLSMVEVDATQLRQVVMNLVVNASDAIGNQPGKISVKVRESDLSAEDLAGAYAAPGLPPGRYVCLDVTDSGCGMDVATQNRIFDPFFTTKVTGHGLGLAAVLGIIRSHQGAIRVQSEPGRGTTFTVLLPALEAEESGASNPVAALSPWSASGTILIVDDDQAVRRLTRRAVSVFGFEVAEAVDGQDGVEQYAARQRELSAVILDMTMPRLNGEQALKEIRRINPAAKVILMSGYANDEAARSVHGEQPDAFVQKPYTLETLRKTLLDVIGESGRFEATLPRAA